MVNRSGSTKRRLNETQHRQSKTHEMGMQISRGIHPEVSQEKHLRMGEKRVRADHPGFSPAERERSGGGASDGRPCAHAVVDTTEVLGVRGGGVYQGQECNRDSSEFHWIERRTLWGRTFGRGNITCTEICVARYLFNLLPPNPQPDKLERLRCPDDMKSAINKAWEHGGADFQSRFYKSTAQGTGDERRGATSFV